MAEFSGYSSQSLGGSGNYGYTPQQTINQDFGALPGYPGNTGTGTAGGNYPLNSMQGMIQNYLANQGGNPASQAALANTPAQDAAAGQIGGANPPVPIDQPGGTRAIAAPQSPAAQANQNAALALRTGGLGNIGNMQPGQIGGGAFPGATPVQTQSFTVSPNVVTTPPVSGGASAGVVPATATTQGIGAVVPANTGAFERLANPGDRFQNVAAPESLTAPGAGPGAFSPLTGGEGLEPGAVPGTDAANPPTPEAENQPPDDTSGVPEPTRPGQGGGRGGGQGGGPQTGPGDSQGDGPGSRQGTGPRTGPGTGQGGGMPGGPMGLIQQLLSRAGLPPQLAGLAMMAMRGGMFGGRGPGRFPGMFPGMMGLRGRGRGRFGGPFGGRFGGPGMMGRRPMMPGRGMFAPGSRGQPYQGGPFVDPITGQPFDDPTSNQTSVGQTGPPALSATTPTTPAGFAPDDAELTPGAQSGTQVTPQFTPQQIQQDAGAAARGQPNSSGAPQAVLNAARQVAMLGGPGAVANFMRQQGFPMNGPWCGEFVASVMHAAGLPIPKNPQIASNWRNWGRRVRIPRPGDIAVRRGAPTGGTGSHVTIVRQVGGDGRMLVTGGNQRGGMTEWMPMRGFDFYSMNSNPGIDDNSTLFMHGLGM